MKTIQFHLLISLAFFGFCQGGSLTENFYIDSCPQVETMVQDIIWRHVSSNPQLPAKLLRLQAHDCFVRGCDASVLLDSTAENKAEKDAPQNKFVSGYEVIDNVKEEVEAACPGVVSCADILALAARDAVSFQFQKPIWQVLTGRRDGTLSKQTEAAAHVPDSYGNFSSLVKNYAAMGLSAHDLVVLNGAHTIGTAHCFLFNKRLYNFTGKGDVDPSFDPSYANALKKKCPNNLDKTLVADMDRTPLSFDNDYFVLLKENKGLFTADATVMKDKMSSEIVNRMLDSETFLQEFGEAMQRFSEVGVLTGDEGEIRLKCNSVNNKNEWVWTPV
ncbi:peroxidase [Ranunculus cassubicifolius]